MATNLSTAMTNSQRQLAFRARRLAEGKSEVRGIYLPAELHLELRAHARKLLKAKAGKPTRGKVQSQGE